jgi:hypothetical protein
MGSREVSTHFLVLLNFIAFVGANGRLEHAEFLLGITEGLLLQRRRYWVDDGVFGHERLPCLAPDDAIDRQRVTAPIAMAGLKGPQCGVGEFPEDAIDGYAFEPVLPELVLDEFDGGGVLFAGVDGERECWLHGVEF